MNTEMKTDKKTMAGLWVGILVGAAIAGAVSYYYSPQTRYVIKTEVTQKNVKGLDELTRRTREEVRKTEEAGKSLR